MIEDLSIDDLYKLRVVVNNRIEEIETKALSDLSQGNEVAGFKLAVGRMSRKWVDTDKVSALLNNHGFSNDDIYDIKMKGIPAIEKLVKGTDVDLSSHINVSNGKPSLVYTGESE